MPEDFGQVGMVMPFFTRRDAAERADDNSLESDDNEDFDDDDDNADPESVSPRDDADDSFADDEDEDNNEDNGEPVVILEEEEAAAPADEEPSAEESDTTGSEAAPIHGATVPDEPPRVSMSVKNLLNTIIPAMKEAREAIGAEYEAQIIEPVKRGEVTKEYTLRTIAALAFNDDSTDIAEAILNDEEARDAVYEVLGL
jgi:hypothetical protein